MKEKDLFNINNINKIPLNKGVLLVSPPLMGDGIFHKSVVLLLQHNEEEGTVGLILNKPTTFKVSDILKALPDFHEEVFFGGPVSPNHTQVLHRLSSMPESTHIINDIYWGGNYPKIFEMLELNYIDSSDIKFYVGYAGWAPGQLEDEMEKNFWILVNAEKYDLWDRPESLWEKIITELGLDPKIATNIPDNPMYN